MPINEEYIFTYDDYLAIKYAGGFVCVAESDTKYKLEAELKEEIHQKHDKSFKDVLSNREEMAFLLKEFIGIEVDAKELQEYKNEFITKKYSKRQADTIYKNTEKEIYYMVEHQSSKDRKMPQRIEEYCVELMNDVLKNSSDEVYPTIVPIVLYTGKGIWDVETNFAERQKYSVGSYEEYKIDIKYTVVDINTIKDMELLEKQDYLANVMLMEKCETDEDRMKMLEKIHKEMKSKVEQDKILYYFVNVYGRTLKPEDKKKLYEKLKRSDDKMTVLQQSMIEERKAIARKSREEGRTQGRVEGRTQGREEGRTQGRTEGRTQGKAEVAQNLIKIKMPIEQIMKVTGLNKEEVEKLEKLEEKA